MATNYVANPSGASLTGWTKTAGTFEQTSEGVRWYGSGAAQLIVAGNSSMVDDRYYKASGVKIKKNTNFTSNLSARIRGGAEATYANYVRVKYTDMPVGVFQTLPASGKCYYNKSVYGGTPAFAFILENASGAFDITIANVGIYVTTDMPVDAVIDANDATFSIAQPANSLTQTFSKSAGNEAVDFLTWSWGDGTAATSGDAAGTASVLSKAHAFPSPGRYTVRLTSKNTVGKATESGAFASSGNPDGAFSQTTYTEQTVTVPAGTFTAAYTSQAEYLNVLVDASSSVAPSIDPVDVYEWDWGDGSAHSFGVQQSHAYSAAGGYPVKLTTKTNESLRSSTVTKTITVVAAPNAANYFTATRNLLSVLFSPSISGASSYAWDFGDGTTDAVQSPTHVYGTPGTYAVTLTVGGTQTTTQSITVYAAYRQLTRLSDALRLEVAVPYAAGVIYNRLPNASGGQGAWGWSSPVSGSYITASSTSDTADDHGIPDAKLIYHAAGSTTQQMLSQSVRVAAGQYVGAQMVTPYVEGYVRLTVDALNSAGTVLGSSAASGYQQASTAAFRTTPYLLPTGTTNARLRIEFYGSNTGTVPAAGKVMQVRYAMLSTAATSAELTSNPYVSSRQWVDVIGPTAEITTGRSALDVGTLQATVLESGYDPATSGTIRPGQGVRLRAQTEDGSGNVIWQSIFTGTLTGAQVTYNTKRKDTDPKSTSIALSATDATTVLTQKSQPSGVATLAELPALLETAGVPYEVNGASGQVPSANVVAINENASVLDQVAITRDTTGSFAFVSRAGVLTAVDSAHLSGAVTGVVDETAYSGIDASFDTEACINSVTIKWLRYTPANGSDPASTEEITYGPYEDAASIDEWGFQPAEFTMQGVENATNIANKAAAILAANKVPVRQIKATTVPIRYLEDLSRGKALVDLYDLVQLGYARTGTNTPARVQSIRHTITPNKWRMELGFTPNGSVAAPQQTPSPPDPVQTPGGKYNGQAAMTATYTTTVTVTDVPSMTLTVPVTSSSQVFMVSINLDINSGSATASNFIGMLNVAGTDQARQFVMNMQTVNGLRFDSGQVWRVTGLTPGSVVFKFRARSDGVTTAPTGTHLIRSPHSAITIWEV